MKDVLDWMNVCFTIVFTLEAIIKIIAYSGRYFKISSNIFDFCVVIVSIIGLTFQFKLNYSKMEALTLIRTLRIGRIFRLFRKVESIELIFEAFTSSVPQLLNVGGLLTLIIFIYSVIAMNFFSQVKLNGIMTNHLNFQTIWNSAISLFVMSTGNYFYELTHEVSIKNTLHLTCIANPTF